MSLRLSSSQSAHFVSLWGGLGIPGDEVPTDGDNGGSPLANDGISPTSEYRIETVTAPSAGTLTVFPDTSYEFSDAPDGSYTWEYRVWEDSIDRGTATEYLVVGSPVVAFSAVPALPAFSGDMSISPVVQTDATPGLPVFSGVIGSGASVAFDVVTEPPAFSGSIKSSPAVQTDAFVELPTFLGSISSEGVSVSFDATPEWPVFVGSVSSSPIIAFALQLPLPAFSGSISSGVTTVSLSRLSQVPLEDRRMTVAAEHRGFVATVDSRVYNVAAR